MPRPRPPVPDLRGAVRAPFVGALASGLLSGAAAHLYAPPPPPRSPFDVAPVRGRAGKER